MDTLYLKAYQIGSVNHEQDPKFVPPFTSLCAVIFSL